MSKAECPALLDKPTFRDFVCMYIGEGYKRSRNVVSICNSDPAVIRLGATWIRQLSDHRMACSFQYHADQEPRELCAFWGRLLDVDTYLRARPEAWMECVRADWA
jgi:hypothetical protein